MENWQELKQRVYHEDGRLRDIYVNDTTLEDWRKWIDFVNQNYKVEFTKFFEEPITLPFIDYQLVEQYVLDETGQEISIQASIALGHNVEFDCYFFWEGEIENDINPIEIQTNEQHLAILKYLKGISQALKKKVILTEENMQELILIEVNGDNVKINF